MQINSTQNSSFIRRKIDTATNFVAENPYRTLTDVYDVSMGSIASLGLQTGAPAGLITGAAMVGGLGHAGSAIYNAIEAGSSWGDAAKQHGVRAAGDALISAGMFMAAAGVGPLSLGFIGTGLVAANIAETI